MNGNRVWRQSRERVIWLGSSGREVLLSQMGQLKDCYSKKVNSFLLYRYLFCRIFESFEIFVYKYLGWGKRLFYCYEYVIYIINFNESYLKFVNLSLKGYQIWVCLF